MPDESPKVSVVVPAYNSAGTLRRAVESVLCQSEPSVEVVVVDDASTDGTLGVARRLEAEDPRVRVLALPENGGVSRARNRGTAHARGEWIAVLDADDRYLPARLETLLRHGREQGVDMVADNQHHVAAAGGTPLATAFPSSAGGRSIGLSDFIAHSDPAAGFSLGLLKPMIRAGFIRRTGLAYREGTTLAEDFYHLLQFFVAGGRAWLVHEPLYEWTLPFDPATRRWTTTGRGAWRYDYRNALEANAHFIEALGADARPEVLALLRRRERQYRVMVPYIEAQRAWDEGRDAPRAFGIIVRHPGTWPVLARRLAGRLRRAAPGAVSASSGATAADPAPRPTLDARAPRARAG